MFIIVADGVVQMKEEQDNLHNYAEDYAKMTKLVAQGDVRAHAEIAELRGKLTVQRLSTTEIESQYKLLKAQCDMNRDRRANDGRITTNHQVLCALAGEGKAMHVIAGEP